MDTTGSADPVPEGSSGEGHRRRRAIVLSILGVVVVAGLVGGIWFASRWSDRGSDQASLEEARARAEGAEVAEGLLQPASGLYTFASTGTESLSLLGTTQSWGATTPATVTASQGGCWTLRLDYSNYHWNAQTYCPRARVLEETTTTGYQAFDFVATTVSEQTEWLCDPPGQAIRLDAEPGDSWEQSCDGASAARGTSVTSAGTNEFVGEEKLSIDGEDVTVFHYKVTRDLSGDQSGHEENELWYHARTGLLVKTVRNVQVSSPSPIGDVVYHETGELVLTSLTPS
jgi:hypothetical protein